MKSFLAVVAMVAALFTAACFAVLRWGPEATVGFAALGFLVGAGVSAVAITTHLGIVVVECVKRASQRRKVDKLVTVLREVKTELEAELEKLRAAEAAELERLYDAPTTAWWWFKEDEADQEGEDSLDIRDASHDISQLPASEVIVMCQVNNITHVVDGWAPKDRVMTLKEFQRELTGMADDEGPEDVAPVTTARAAAAARAQCCATDKE